MSSFMHKGWFRNRYGSLEVAVLASMDGLDRELGLTPLSSVRIDILVADGWPREALEQAANGGFAYAARRDCLFRLDG